MENKVADIKREFDPSKNDRVIALVKQDDGNYKGWMQKNGKLIEVREISPEYALSKLLTHE